MELSIAFAQNSDCQISIQDNTGFNPDTDGFISEDGISSDSEYKLSEVYLHTYLVYNKVSGSIVSESDMRSIDAIGGGDYTDLVPDVTLDMNYDGYFTVYYIAIPTQTISETTDRYAITDPDTLYYSDGNDIFLNETTEALDPLEVIAQLEGSNNIVSAKQDLFSTCRINKCYLDYIYTIAFNNLGQIKCDMCDITSEDNLKKELLAGALFVINGLIDDFLYMEAQNITEQIMVCNGLCSDFSNYSRNSTCCS